MPTSVFNQAAIAEDALREASKIKFAVTDAVKDKLRVANHQIRRGRYAAEDAFDEAKHAVKQRPIETLVIAFASGLLAGSILMCAVMSRRH